MGSLTPTDEGLATAADSELLSSFAEFLNLDVAAGAASLDTVKTYLSQVQQYLRWCCEQGISPTRATSEAIKAYRRWMFEAAGYKQATIGLKLTVVRRFYQAAVERGLVAANPAAGVKPPLEHRDPAERIAYLEKPELQALLDAVPDDGSVQALRDKLALGLMGLEGCRTVELHRANLGDIVRQGARAGLRVRGKRNIRIVPLTEAMALCLQQYLEAREGQGESLGKESPLFVSLSRRSPLSRLTRRSIRRIVDGYLRATNLKHRPGRTLSAHSLRHTAGTLALRAGADLRQVQDLLGHADPRTTAIYAHVGDRWSNNPASLLGIRF